MPHTATRLVRKMRGGAQAHLMEADDGRFYVVKFRNNPQHRRILINELISSVFLHYLKIASPAGDLIRLTTEFLAANPDIHIQLGSHRHAVEPGWHFGSLYPGDPDRIAVYDFVPDALLDKVENRRDFTAMVPFDKWICNADARQAVFFRAKLKEWAPAAASHPLRVGFLALMIDHGYTFEGPHWNFVDSPLQGLYFRTSVYREVRSEDDFQPWLDQVTHFPEEIVDEAYRRIPPEWLDGEEAVLEGLLERLLARRKRVVELVADCRKARSNPFPAWQ
jgi:hypothetical protein